MDRQQVTERLEQIVTSGQILTDQIDLYVYSVEKMFDKHPSAPDIIIRTLSPEETQEILALSDKNFIAVKRGSPIDVHKSDKPLVLLDDSPTPELRRTTEKECLIAEISAGIHQKGHGSPRNLALAVKTLLLGNNLAECAECRTCSGYCTVASSFDGVETWSSKGRIRIVRGLQGGELSASKKVADIIFTCTECGLCFAQCFEDVEVDKAILTTRNQIAEQGFAPEVFHEAARNIKKTGNPGGVSTNRRLSWSRDITLQPLPDEARILYWVGCMVAERTPRTSRAFLKILNRAKVDYTMLMERENCCGYVLISTGLWNEAKEAAKQTLSAIEKTKAKTLVTPCAGCYYTFSKLYPEVLEISLPCEIYHSTSLTESLVKTGKLGLKSLELTVSYHDPCSLGRHCGVFDPPRNLLKAIPDLTFTELPLNRELARCCGGGGGLWSFNNRISMNTAYSRLKDMQARELDVLATACPLCQMNLRYTATRKSIPVKVCGVSEIVESALA